ncbi:MAG: hypothetical protein OXI40_13230 [Chloroflexota bacterium]|nr:hypothetical protein [Chloroflexota bacterium]
MLKRLFIALLLFFALPSASAQDGVTVAMREQLLEIQQQVIERRELDLLSEAPLTFPSRGELNAFLKRRFLEDYPPQQLEIDLVFLRALDLAPPELDLEAALRDFWLTWIGGYYNIIDGSINIVVRAEDGALDALTIPQQVIYAHEIVHALQDQHFDLERIIDDANKDGNRDRRLAIHALFEGDANYIMIDFLRRLSAADSDAVNRAYAAVREAGSEPEIPPVIIEAIEFPYRQGYLFIVELIAALGWEGVNQALRDNPPQTTEQIYHPQRYLAGEGAIPVSLPDHGEIVGVEWRSAYDGPVGEFFLRQHLGVYLAEFQADDLASGWGGDRMRVFTNETDDQLIWVLYQKWDSPHEAGEFARGYQHLLERRYRQVSADGRCWVAETTHCLAQVGEKETRISAAPRVEQALALLALGD